MASQLLVFERGRPRFRFLKNFSFAFTEFVLYSAPSRPNEGTLRGRHGRRVRDAMGAGVAAWFCRADERSLVHGEVAWSWPPDAEVKPAGVAETQPAGDGGKQARSPGRSRISRQTSRREGRVIGQTCGTCRLHFFRRRATGAASARPSLRPRFGRGRRRCRIARAQGAARSR